MYIYIFYVNIIIFLITKTGKVLLLLVTKLTSRSNMGKKNTLSSDQTKYQTRRSKIMDIHGENGFIIKELEDFL